jgi:hypothetical protein
MIRLSWDNYLLTLNWTALHPALGAPLLDKMITNGYADDFGKPVFMQQDELPTTLTLIEFLKKENQRPYFVGRYVERAGAACSGECSAAVQSPS